MDVRRKTQSPAGPVKARDALAGLMWVRRRGRRALTAQDRRLQFAVWHHRTTSGGRLHFEQRPYLVPIYLDRSPVRVFKKAVQCGVSEFLLIDALESASRGLACLYVLPTQEKRDVFVGDRVDRVLRASEYYQSLLGSAAGRANRADLKHFGRGVLRFVGSNAQSEFVEFPADLVIVDEYNRCAQSNLPLVRDRLAASAHKLAAYASTPTVPGYGIAPLFDASDAKEWFVRCDACRTAQPLDFFANVARREGEHKFVLLDRDCGDGSAGRDVSVFCAHCGRPIDRLAPGEWVARHPGREASGYHICQLFVPTITVRQLWADWQRAVGNDWERQRFWNSMLGEPYAAEGGGLSLGDLAACVRDYELPRRATACSMGVDVGEWFHVRISDQPEHGVRRAVFIGRVRSTEELDQLIERYDVRCCVIDALPESLLVRKWQRSHPRGRVWRAMYSDNDLRELTRDGAEGLLHVSRTPSLDDATHDILTGRNWLPRNVETLDGGDYVAQMTAPVRQLVTDPRGNQRYAWTHSAADHHRHADNYDKIAAGLMPGAGVLAPVVGQGARTFPPPRGRVFKAA